MEKYITSKKLKMSFQKNIFFKTSSDTEVIIEAYKYWGVEFIKLLRGMFAFCIFDKFKENNSS